MIWRIAGHFVMALFPWSPPPSNNRIKPPWRNNPRYKAWDIVRQPSNYIIYGDTLRPAEHKYPWDTLPRKPRYKFVWVRQVSQGSSRNRKRPTVLTIFVLVFSLNGNWRISSWLLQTGLPVWFFRGIRLVPGFFS